MKTDQLKYAIGITLINGIGNNIAKNLIAYLGNEESVFNEKKKNLSKIPGIGEKLAHEISSQKHVLKNAEKEIEFMLKNDIGYFYYAEKNYPFRLKECSDAPLILFHKGKTNVNAPKIVSIVGTRHATGYGKEICQNLIKTLSELKGLLIVSGLAYGIDICAHNSSLENKIPTLGVVAHGLDRIYPQMHRNTAVKMLEEGGLITEYVSGTNPDRQNFVQRNRIIAGMSDAIVVIESAEKGGALLTADFAVDYNRDIFAFPGRINDQYSKGCNKLIYQQKASLINDGTDLMQLMGWEKGNSRTSSPQLNLFQELSETEQQIYSKLKSSSEPVHVNMLALELEMPYSKLTALLLELEFKSLIKSLPGGIYQAV